MPISNSDTISPNFSAAPSRDGEDESCSIATQVLAVPKLLEMILEHVDVRDVLHAYRINRSTQDIIEASTKLQTKLFLRPANPESALSVLLSSDGRNFRQGGIAFSRGSMLEDVHPPATSQEDDHVLRLSRD
ncbi:hypothetical protein LTR37_019671 [Vermiconidia calcicola]|uniref:Uncharacterized protein n=1 Tax=Vermiconidia calcicola TaxID=1690605 RepID=A0ACC3MDJ9_9PEZI|nr:hypothetical protein LTR37_019671 [Vermiconidia calcicola]